jgi:hypothetical protein
MTDFGSGPAADEIEVTVMGPGYGESIVVHATNNFWIVVDSCIPSGEKVAAAISYLNAIGVDLAAVRFVVSTHWHDDHVRGISQVLNLSPNAKLVLASALQQKEFMQIATAFGNTSDAVVPGASELAECFRIIRARTAPGARPSAVFASSGKILWNMPVGDIQVKIDVLSPSDADITEAIRRFSELWPGDRAPLNRVPPSHPNHVAMALHIAIGEHSVLLGADLEKTVALDSGWEAVLSDNTRQIGKSTLYKVAHHGSITGHHDGIWERLLEAAPTSLLTPFRRGRVKLPKETDKHRIRLLSGESFITSPAGQAFVRTTPEQRTLSKRAQNVQPSTDSYGILRTRTKVGATNGWAVEVFGSADNL